MIPDLTKGQRRHLRRAYQRATDTVFKIRALIVIRLAESNSSVEIEQAGICVRSTVSYVATRFRNLGELGLEDGRRLNGKKRKLTEEVLLRLAELIRAYPQDFGWARTTWTRELLVRQLYRETRIRLSLTTLSFCLRKMGARWGRPKPYVVCPWSPRRRRKRLAQIKKLVTELPAGEKVFYEDEVDIHLNPKIGPDWMLKGTQKLVLTPGKNQKHYLAGALDPKTGQVTWVEGGRKASQLFIDLLHALVRRYRGYTKLHVVLDNYSIHSSKITRRAVDDLGGRVELHYLPPFCPDDNRIERLWEDLHANVTRNHRCRSMAELLREVRRYLVAVQPYPGSKPALRRDRRCVRESTAVI